MTKLPPLNSWFHLFTSKTVGLHDNMIVKGRNVGERKIFSHFKSKWKKWNGKCKLWFQWNSTKNIHLQKLSWIGLMGFFDFWGLTFLTPSLAILYGLVTDWDMCPSNAQIALNGAISSYWWHFIFFQKFQVLLIKCVFPQLRTLTNTLHS